MEEKIYGAYGEMLFLKSDKKTKKYSAVSLAELLVALSLIGIIAAFLIVIIESNSPQQKEILSKFDMSYTNLSNVIAKVIINQNPNATWKFDADTLNGLTCVDENGAAVANRSLCFRKALIDNSSNIQACTTEEDCFPDYSTLFNKLKGYYANITQGETASIKLPGAVTALIAYVDSGCELQIPINKISDDETEYVKGCGVMVIDANGTHSPNNLIISDTDYVDRFLVAITKNGLVKSKYLSSLACGEGKEWVPVLKRCVEKNVCSHDMQKAANMKNVNKLGNIVIEDVVDPDTCYAVKCKYLGSVTLSGVCPNPPENTGEGRYGGLWVSEGGSLADEAEKASCIPIENVQDLNNINNNLAGNYCLNADLVVDSVTFSASIGSNQNPFTGNFYGNGHTISGLTVSLFESIAGDTNKKIENLGLINVNINGYGSLAKIISGTNLNSIFATGTINSPGSTSVSEGNNTGGIVGTVNIGEGSFSDIYFVGNINVATMSNNSAGGLFGVGSRLLERGYFDGNITLEESTGNAYLGGLIGYSEKAVSDVYAKATVVDNACLADDCIGNIIGQHGITPISSNLYSIGTVNTGEACATGGLFGDVNGSGSLANAYSTVRINTGSSNANALIGTIESGATYSVSNAFWSSALSGKSNAFSQPLVGINRIPTTFDTNFNTLMPPQPHRDCRNGQSAAGGCIDVFGTSNSWDFNTTWAWITPTAIVKNPVFRWQCKPYKTNGYDCCRPRRSSESKFELCPAYSAGS